MHKLNLLILLLSLTYLNAQEKLHPQLNRGEIIEHTYYTLSYAEQHEQAYWVFYELTRDEVKGGVKRSDDFREDPKVASMSASLEDYKGSGYDRGHIAPAADMAFNQTAMSESFYLSNMSPQHPSFNRGYWKKLESEVRNWAYSRGQIFVASGPVLNQSFNQIGPNNVSIPKYYYKVLLDTLQNTAIAFLMPNQKCSGSLMDYVVTVDSLENFTGIDFNAHLDDNLENQIESQKNIEQWPFIDVQIEKRPTSKNATTAKRCKGTTQSGNQCKRRTKSKSGYCWQHD